MIRIRPAKTLSLITALLIILFSPIAPVFAFSTLSIQPAGFSSNDKYLNGEAWLLTVSEDGNSQYAEGYIEAEDITGSDGQHAKQDLTIKTDVTEQSCDYQLKQNYDPNIYAYDLQLIKSSVASWSVNKYVSQCEEKSNYYWAFLAEGGLFVYDVYCMTRDKIGVPGTVKTPVTNFEAKISMTAAGDTETGTISSTGAKSARLANIGYAHWAGSLSSGESCPNLGSEGYYVVHDESGNWVLNKKYLYNTYLSYKQNTYDQVESEIINEIYSYSVITTSSLNRLKTSVNNLDYYARDATNEFGYKDFKVTQNSISNGQAHMVLDRLIQFPVITMHVKASWLGIVAPVGEPDITSVSSKTFEEGKTGYITVALKNKGDVTASFGLSADCESPFKQIGTALTISNLGAGKSTTKSIPITATTNKDLSKYCTVEAYDLNNPNMKDSRKVTVSVTPIRLCDPGDERCDGETHKVCNSAGSAWVKTDSDKCKGDDDDDDDPVEELCVYTKDGEDIELYTTQKDCCELKGGRFDPGYDAPWYKFWEKDKPAKCYIGHVSVLGIMLIIAGIGLFFTPMGPYAFVISGIGVIIQILAGLGFV